MNAFYNSKVQDIIHDLLNEGIDSFCQVDQTKLDDMVLECIKILEEDGSEYSCIINSDNFPAMMIAFKNFIYIPSRENSLELANTMRDNAREYFEPKLQEIFNDQLEWRESSIRIDNNMKKHVDMNNGEVTYYSGFDNGII